MRYDDELMLEILAHAPPEAMRVLQGAARRAVAKAQCKRQVTRFLADATEEEVATFSALQN